MIPATRLCERMIVSFFFMTPVCRAGAAASKIGIVGETFFRAVAQPLSN
jgi:hypothetical protein